MSTTQRHAATMAPKNWKFGEYSDPRKFSVFGRHIGPKFKKPGGFILGREYGEVVIKKSE